jgi:hypothetical protein
MNSGDGDVRVEKSRQKAASNRIAAINRQFDDESDSRVFGTQIENGWRFAAPKNCALKNQTESPQPSKICGG